MAGLTLEELVKRGARPGATQAVPRASQEELRAAGAINPDGPVKVGAAETLGTNYADVVTGGHSDELGAGLQAALQWATRGVKDADGNPVPVMDVYRQARGENRERQVVGPEQNKWAGRVGTGLGVGASVLLGSKLPGGAVSQGAAFGGLHGAGSSEADLTRGEWSQFADDTIGFTKMMDAGREFGQGNLGRGALRVLSAGALGGGLTGGAIQLGTNAVRRPLANALRRLGISQSRNVIQGGSDIAAPTRVPLSDEAVEEALKSGAIAPFRDTKGTYAALENLSREQGEEYARILAALEARGVTGPEAKAVAAKLMESHAREAQTALADKVIPNTFKAEAENLVDLAAARPYPPQQIGPGVVRVKSGSPRLGLTQAEGIKQNMQRAARLDRLKQNPTDEAYEEMARTMRQANEDAIQQAATAAGPGSEIAQEAAKFVPVKQRLGRLIEARTAAERGAVKAMARPSVGLKDAVIGSATGDPVSAYIAAMGSSAARNRLPSTVASGAYGLSNALHAGTVSPALTRAAQSYATPIERYVGAYDNALPTLAAEPSTMERQQARAEAVRRRRRR